MARAVLFDIDDTLIDFRGADNVGMSRYLDELIPGIAAQDVAGAQACWDRLGDRHFGLFVAGRLGFQEQRRRRARAFCARYLIPLGTDDESVDRWFGGYLRHCEEALRPFPDVEPALRALRDAGLPLGAVSNSIHATQHRKLGIVGLRSWFDALVCCDDAGGIGKPDPRMFHVGCRALGIDPADVAYVGDDLDKDARGSSAAGLTGYWLNRRGVAGRFPRTVTDLAELARLLTVPHPQEASR